METTKVVRTILVEIFYYLFCTYTEYTSLYCFVHTHTDTHNAHALYCTSLDMDDIKGTLNAISDSEPVADSFKACHMR